MSKPPHPAAIERAMSEAMQALQYLDPTTIDEKLIRDTIEGQTNVFEILDALAERAIGDSKLAELASARSKRLEARTDAARAVLMRMIMALGMESVERATYTASIGYRSHVQITDPKKIPDDFIRRAPDKVKLAVELNKGKTVTGAELSNKAPHLRLTTI